MIPRTKNGGIPWYPTSSVSYVPIGDLYAVHTTYALGITFPKYFKKSRMENVIDDTELDAMLEYLRTPFNISHKESVVINVERCNFMAGYMYVTITFSNTPPSDRLQKVFTSRVREAFKDMRDIIRLKFAEYLRENKLKYKGLKR